MKQVLKIITFLIVVPTMIVTEYHIVKNEKFFKLLLNRYEYCVVCFVPSQAEESSKISADEKQNILQRFKNLENSMQAAAKKDDFKDWLKKDIGFLLVDISFKQASDLADEYEISKFPTCLVFDGEFAVKKTLSIAPKYASDLIKMLQRHFGEEITKLIIQRKKERNVHTAKHTLNYNEYGSYNNNWIPDPVYPYSRWGSGPYGVSYDMSGLQNL